MPTHVFNSGAGIGAQVGETGGVSGGGGGTAPAGTTTIEEIQSETGSNEQGVQASQIGFANAPSGASASSRVSLIWNAGSTTCHLYVEDDSGATGESGTSDLSASTRPVASRPPLLNDFSGATGDSESEQYNRSLSTYSYGVKEVNYVDGEGFNDTARGDIYYNSVKVYDAGFNMGSTWSVGDSVPGDSDNYTYTVGSYQEVYNGDEYYAVIRGVPAEEHYRFTTTNTVTKLKMDYEVNTLTTASGVTVPLRTLAGNPMTSGSNSSGWITSGLNTGITLNIQQLTGVLSDDTKVHVTDGVVKLYAGDSTNEGLLKQFRLRVYTTATSTY